MKKTTKLIALIIALFMMITALTACDIQSKINELLGKDPCKDGHTYDNTCDEECNVCQEKRTVTHTPAADDGDCTTAVLCSVCGKTAAAAKMHSYDNDCDASCNNEGCNQTRATSHTPAVDDGDCTTAVFCYTCKAEIVAAKEHSFDNDCDTSCNNDGCKNTRVTSHTPIPDDGDCTTVVLCSVCGETVTEAKTHAFATVCDSTCNNEGCNHTRVTSHTPLPDDGNCTTVVLCSVCGETVTEAKEHAFDNDCDTSCNNEGCNHTRTTQHTDADDDSKCDSCGENIPAHVCKDDDGDGKCDLYGEPVSGDGGCKNHPRDEDNDGFCDGCGQSITLMPSVPLG